MSRSRSEKNKESAKMAIASTRRSAKFAKVASDSRATLAWPTSTVLSQVRTAARAGSTSARLPDCLDLEESQTVWRSEPGRGAIGTAFAGVARNAGNAGNVSAGPVEAGNKTQSYG